MYLRRLPLRSAVALAVCLLSGRTLLAQPAVPQAATSKEPEMSITDIKHTIRERGRALAEIPGEGPPGFSSWTMEYADKAVAGMLAFEGGVWVNVGASEIDWSGSQYPHVEWVATLNRFRYLLPLASAYEKTHDERYATAARAYMEDWLRYDPGFAARRERGDNTLNISTRLRSWTQSLPLFLDSPAFDEAFLRTMLDSIAIQGRDLSRYLTATNFRVRELDALVGVALRLPFLDNAKELLDIGLTGMRANLAAQFLPDGVHVERTPGYHDGMADVLVKYVRLGKQFPEADAQVDLEVVRRALDYSAQSSLSAFNDCRILYRDPENLRGAEQRAETLNELFPDETSAPLPPLEQVFSSAGHVFARSAWEPTADYLAFDAGTWGGGHNHLSRLSFTFRAGGRVLVADPGCPSYEMSDPLAIYLRATPAHSTLNLNDGNQSDIDAQLLRTEFTPATALIQARYQGGYWPGRFSWSFEDRHGQGVFGRHNRTLFWVRGEYLLALDAMEADPDTTVHNVWQMGPMAGWAKDEGKLAWWSQNSDSNLFLKLIPFTEDVRMQCFDGSRDPLRGWLGRNQQEVTAAPQVDFSYPCAGGSSASAVLLVPFLGDHQPSYVVKRIGTAGGRHGGELLYELEVGLPDGGTDLVVWSGTLETALEELPSTLTSDGTFIWLRTDASGRPVKGFVLDGSFVSHHGKIIYEGAKREATLLAFDH
jgi:hypothetical protein